MTLEVSGEAGFTKIATIGGKQANLYNSGTFMCSFAGKNGTCISCLRKIYKEEEKNPNPDEPNEVGSTANEIIKHYKSILGYWK